MSEIKEYKIAVPQAAIERLQQKLALTELPDELDDAGWDYGAPLQEVKKLIAYWQNNYDWRKHEARLNELPNYTTDVEVEGFGKLQTHFVYQKSAAKDAIPLLFVHGWPGNFTEVSKLLPLLANPKEGAPAFHVVAPSLPNFGFSQGVKKRGFGMPQYAELCHNLMAKLGYKEYVTQGGDWGFWITRTIGRLFPQACKASLVNMTPLPLDVDLDAARKDAAAFSGVERQSVEKLRWFRDDGSGYSHQQRSKPQSLGYGLSDSPALLLGWILEKLHDWTDAYPWTADEILTWVSIYWFSTAGPAANVRIYYEAWHEGESMKAATGHIPEVKLGIMFNWHDMETSPKAWARELGPVVYESDNERGGHFIAWEKPQLVARDLNAMFARGAKAVESLSSSS